MQNTHCHSVQTVDWTDTVDSFVEFTDIEPSKGIPAALTRLAQPEAVFSERVDRFLEFCDTPVGNEVLREKPVLTEHVDRFLEFSDEPVPPVPTPPGLAATMRLPIGTSGTNGGSAAEVK